MTVSNLVALTAVASILGTQQETIAKSMEGVMDKARTAVVQMELRNIQTMFVVEMALGDVHEARKDFPDFIRKNITATKRDPAVDLWGNGYFLNQDTQHYYIASAGPDGEVDTDDDLYFRVSK